MIVKRNLEWEFSYAHALDFMTQETNASCLLENAGFLSMLKTPSYFLYMLVHIFLSFMLITKRIMKKR